MKKKSVLVVSGVVVLLSFVIAATVAGWWPKQGEVRTAPVAVEVREDSMRTEGTQGRPGQRWTVHYEVFLDEEGKPGKKVDSSRDRNLPFDFLLGTGQVFPGWDKAAEGMTVGSKRVAKVPAALAYGERGVQGLIPPNTDLYLEIELLKLE